jgi:hypothetical protein
VSRPIPILSRVSSHDLSDVDGAGARAGHPSHRRALRAGACVTLGMALAAGAAAGAEPAVQAPTPRIATRAAIVTDSCSGKEGAKRPDHRAKALECVADGGRLLLYDSQRDDLYEIAYDTPELRLSVLNDMTGLPIYARGIWDDEHHLVALKGAKLASATRALRPEGAKD